MKLQPQSVSVGVHETVSPHTNERERDYIRERDSG